jgi:hypothetical protein
MPRGFVLDGIGAIHPFEFIKSWGSKRTGRVESICMVRAFGVNGILETGMARHGICAFLFWEGKGEKKEVFEVCGGRDKEGTEARIGRRWIGAEYGWVVGGNVTQKKRRKEGIGRADIGGWRVC